MDESLDLREQDAVVQVFFMRSGRMIGRDHFYLRVARGGYPFAGSVQLPQAVLCGNTVYTEGDHAAG